jgi:glycosyltransferase involved in cell wall biosynthesis
MKKLSVVVPVFNAEKWLSETLDSLLRQTYGNIEILCIDDGSTDKSNELIREYQSQYPQILLIQQENAGVSAARNKGIESASGDYVAFLDADDFVAPVTYEKMISQMEAENSDIIFCEFTRFWADGHTQITKEHSFSRLTANPQDIQYFLLSTESYRDGNTLHTEDIHGSVWRSVFRKRILFESNIRFHSNLKFAEDQIFVLEYLACCKKVSYSKEPYVWYRGWTKTRHYGILYHNQMALVRYQKQIVTGNTYYSTQKKRQLIGYLECSAYFSIANDEFSLNPDCVAKMKAYTKNPDFRKMLTWYNFAQKYRVRPDPKRIVLFILLKLRMWEVTRRFYPRKYY